MAFPGPAIIHSEKMITPAQRVRFGLDPGPRRRVAGGYIDDLVGLKKSIMLCGLCVRKFNHIKYRYIVPRGLRHCFGKCDGCSRLDDGTCFVHTSMQPR